MECNNDCKIRGNMVDGFAYHQFVFDEKGNITDCILEEVNYSFQGIFNVKKDSVLGKRGLDVLAEVYGAILLHVSTLSKDSCLTEKVFFDHYFSKLDKWLEVFAFSDKQGYFAAIFKDITLMRKESLTVKKMLKYTNQCLEMSCESLDYSFFAQTMQELAEAEFVILSILDQDSKDLEIKGLAGNPHSLNKASDILEFPPIGAKINMPDELMGQLTHTGLVRYLDINTVSFGSISREKSELLQESLNIGEIYAIEIICKEQLLGYFTILMPKQKNLNNHNMIELYTHNLGATLSKLKYEMELRRSNEEREMVLDNIDVQVWYLKDEFTTGYVNSAHAKFFNMDKKDLINSRLTNLLHESEANVCVEGNRSVFLEKKQIISREWVRNGIGNMRLLEIVKTPKITKGVVEYVICAARDITEEHFLAKELKESQEKINGILVSLEDVVWSKTLQGEPIFINPAAEKLYGVKLDKFYNEHELWLNMVHPEDKPRVSYIVDEALAKGKTAEEYRIIRPDGEIRWLHDRLRVINDERGAPLRIDGITSDITERKLAEERISQYNLELELKNLELEQLYIQLDGELEKALKIHQRTLPKELPSVSNLSFASHYKPASKLGGDFYDVKLVENKVVFYISDVTGHGLESAMMSVFVKNSINGYLTFNKGNDIEPEKIVNYLTDQFLAENYPDNYFVCIFLAVLDLDTNLLSYVGPGFQDGPLAVLNGEEPCLTELVVGGLPITSTVPRELLEYKVEQLVLSPGTTIMFFTDGLSEHMVKGEYYANRIKELFFKHWKLPPEAFVQKLNDDFYHFNSKSLEGDDDITLLLLQVSPQDRVEHTFTISSHMDEIPVMSMKLVEILPEDDRGQRAFIGIQELVTNALEHGNKYDPQKKAVVKVVIAGEYIVAVVADQGEGFNWREKINKPMEIEGMAERGRGIALTSMCCSTILYNEKGTTAIIILE